MSSAVINRDIKLIVGLSFPAVLQTIVRSAFAIVDAYWVGKIGSRELGALTIATFIVWGVLAVAETIPTGTNSLVAQSAGASQSELARKISLVNIVNTFIYSLLTGVIIIPFLPLFYYIINLPSGLSSLVSEYLVIFCLGLPSVTLLGTVASIFRGYGDTKTPFYLLAFAVILNIFLAPVFIFGVNGFLEWGMRGAAVSTILSYFIAFVAGYSVLRRRNLINRLNSYRIEKQIFTETFKIGLPVSANGLAFSMIYVFVSRFVSDYGTVGFAALGIGHRSESIAYQICVGFSLAATILVGQNIGASKPDRAQILAWKILGVGLIVMCVYSVLLFIFSSQVASIFTNDAGVISAASSYNKFAAAVLIFSAAEVILSGAFSGAGDTLPPVITSLPVNFLRIPLCALLSPLLGLNGIWIAICLSVIIKGIIITIWFGKGKWKNKKSALLKEKVNIIQLTEVE